MSLAFIDSMELVLANVRAFSDFCRASAETQGGRGSDYHCPLLNAHQEIAKLSENELGQTHFV
jgi:hypothetical protein